MWSRKARSTEFFLAKRTTGRTESRRSLSSSFPRARPWQNLASRAANVSPQLELAFGLTGLDALVDKEFPFGQCSCHHRDETIEWVTESLVEQQRIPLRFVDDTPNNQQHRWHRHLRRYDE